MKNLIKFSLAGWMLLALASISQGQNSAVPITGLINSSSTTCPVTLGTLPQCVFQQIVPTVGQVAITVASSPTFSATLQFEWSPDGGNTWVALTSTANAGGTATSTTAAGVWVANVGGATYVRVRSSAYASGVAQVTINPSQVPPQSASSGSGSGTVNAGTSGQIPFYTGSGTTVGPDSQLTDVNPGSLTYTGTSVFFPLGSTSQASIQATGAAAGVGGYFPSTSVFCWLNAGVCDAAMTSTGLGINTTGGLGWPVSGGANGTKDTLICRSAAGTVEVASGSSCAATGTITVATVIENTTLSPTSAATAGVTGQFAWDGTNIYICTVGGAAASATWKKVVLSAD